MSLFSFLSLKLAKKVSLALVLEFGPVVIFILTFTHFHIYKATIMLMVTTIISTIVTYSMQKRLPYLALYVALLTGIFGYSTLLLREPKFIQMRDTLYDVTCALTLIIGLLINVSFLKLAFHKVLPMSMKAWNNLTYAWIGYFITIALANEYIRRTMDLQEWFAFKSAVVGITVVFGIVSLYFLYEKEEEGDNYIRNSEGA
jgi:intracellular septation protein